MVPRKPPISGRLDATQMLSPNLATSQGSFRVPSGPVVNAYPSRSLTVASQHVPASTMGSRQQSLSSIPKPSVDMTEVRSPLSLSFTPQMRSRSRLGDAVANQKQKVECRSEKVPQPIRLQSSQSISQRTVVSNASLNNLELRPQLDEVADVVHATTNALLVPALQETLSRVQELEVALDKERQQNEEMKKASATESSCIQKLREELRAERHCNERLTTSLATESARVQDLQESVRKERQRNDALKASTTKLLAVKLGAWASGLPSRETLDLDRELSDTLQHNEALNSTLLAASMNQQDAQEHSVSTVETKVLKLVSDNEDLSSFVEQVVGKKCLVGFVEQVARYALSYEPQVELEHEQHRDLADSKIHAS